MPTRIVLLTGIFAVLFAGAASPASPATLSMPDLQQPSVAPLASVPEENLQTVVLRTASDTDSLYEGTRPGNFVSPSSTLNLKFDADKLLQLGALNSATFVAIRLKLAAYSFDGIEPGSLLLELRALDLEGKRVPRTTTHLEVTLDGRRSWEWDVSDVMRDFMTSRLKSVLQERSQGQRLLEFEISWVSAASGATFISFQSTRHPNEDGHPSLSIDLLGDEFWANAVPNVIPDNVATDMTLSGSFSTEDWYSCIVSNHRNASMLLKGPYAHPLNKKTLVCRLPPVQAAMKHCSTAGTVDTWGTCYDDIYLVVLRRYGLRQIPLTFSGLDQERSLSITSPMPRRGVANALDDISSSADLEVDGGWW